MHNITKIKIFRILLRITWLPSLLLLYPLALMRKKNSSGLFLFLDRYSLGGAQKVHLDILESVEDQYKEVYFTRLSPDDTMWSRFAAVRMTRLKDIHFWCDNLLFRLFTVHYFAFYLNRHKRVRVFGSNSTFFYDMLPFLRRSVFSVELLHNFSYGKKGMEYFGLMNCRFLSLRTTIDSYTRNQILEMYSEYRVDKIFNERVKVVEFGVGIPEKIIKPKPPPLVICYAGRGGPQKRIPLIGRIAEYFISEKLPVRFRFAGNFSHELSALVQQESEMPGVLKTEEDMQVFFAGSHVLLMTSAFEGFPVVIKESLANSCVPVVPALPGIQTHLVNNDNALLIGDVENEESVVQQGIAHIKLLLYDSILRERLSANGRQYAEKHFDKRVFREAYHLILS